MAISVNNIVKKYGEYTAVNGLSFELKEPGVFALLGTNGAGKSTSIRIILGMLAADKGEVLWDGKPFLACDKPIGYLAEERGLYPKYKIMDQLMYFMTLKGMTPDAAKKAIDYWFDRLEVNEHRNKRAEQLSKGNQQKIQLIAALAPNPELIILDEPAAGMTDTETYKTGQMIKELAKEHTLIVIEHDMEFVEQIADYVTVLHQGRKLAEGPFSEVKNNKKVIQVYLKDDMDEEGD